MRKTLRKLKTLVLIAEEATFQNGVQTSLVMSHQSNRV